MKPSHLIRILILVGVSAIIAYPVYTYLNNLQFLWGLGPGTAIVTQISPPFNQEINGTAFSLVHATAQFTDRSGKLKEGKVDVRADTKIGTELEVWIKDKDEVEIKPLDFPRSWTIASAIIFSLIFLYFGQSLFPSLRKTGTISKS